MKDVSSRQSTPLRVSPSLHHPAASQELPIVGIWRVGQALHSGSWSQLSLAQPADASGSPRFDYVIRQTSDASVEAKRQITNFVASASAVMHPNLIAVLDASTESQTPYLVMPKIDGVTMQSHLEQSPAKKLPVALWMVRQAAQGLQALHGAGWVHGDVKPSNILVGPRGHVTVLDLGFAARVHTITGGSYRGTPAYSAPESLSGQHAAIPAMDMYSLGKILWQWLTQIEPVSQSVLEPVATVVESLVDDDPAKRPTAKKIVKELLKLEIETLGQHIGPTTERRQAA
ncbi:protein kinase [Rubripirellula amarantea]|uniref:Serine/threonine-protein kinase PK-1 n=1 Tax=Rubripirellula amarantea TaxID=2527999 RepID=A0A5C5WRK2_9BACT|nr:protein kinase [Rubripirellula amarantea]MDA8743599.1 protein kinase [Rubripirellula amarantea]TWT52452.1 Serine/threonine-protein kinase PK-1 [Rubripirellula amarantea]